MKFEDFGTTELLTFQFIEENIQYITDKIKPFIEETLLDSQNNFINFLKEQKLLEDSVEEAINAYQKNKDTEAKDVIKKFSESHDTVMSFIIHEGLSHPMILWLMTNQLYFDKSKLFKFTLVTSEIDSIFNVNAFLKFAGKNKSVYIMLADFISSQLEYHGARLHYLPWLLSKIGNIGIDGFKLFEVELLAAILIHRGKISTDNQDLNKILDVLKTTVFPNSIKSLIKLLNILVKNKHFEKRIEKEKIFSVFKNQKMHFNDHVEFLTIFAREKHLTEEDFKKAIHSISQHKYNVVDIYFEFYKSSIELTIHELDSCFEVSRSRKLLAWIEKLFLNVREKFILKEIRLDFKFLYSLYSLNFYLEKNKTKLISCDDFFEELIKLKFRNQEMIQGTAVKDYLDFLFTILLSSESKSEKILKINRVNKIAIKWLLAYETFISSDFEAQAEQYFLENFENFKNKYQLNKTKVDEIIAICSTFDSTNDAVFSIISCLEQKLIVESERGYFDAADSANKTKKLGKMTTGDQKESLDHASISYGKSPKKDLSPDAKSKSSQHAGHASSSSQVSFRLPSHQEFDLSSSSSSQPSEDLSEKLASHKPLNTSKKHNIHAHIEDMPLDFELDDPALSESEFFLSSQEPHSQTSLPDESSSSSDSDHDEEGNNNNGLSQGRYLSKEEQEILKRTNQYHGIKYEGETFFKKRHQYIKKYGAAESVQEDQGTTVLKGQYHKNSGHGNLGDSIQVEMQWFNQSNWHEWEEAYQQDPSAKFQDSGKHYDMETKKFINGVHVKTRHIEVKSNKRKHGEITLTGPEYAFMKEHNSEYRLIHCTGVGTDHPRAKKHKKIHEALQSEDVKITEVKFQL